MDDRQSARLTHWLNDSLPHISLGTQEMAICASQNHMSWASAFRARPASLLVVMMRCY